jgi:hypothetical protein
MRALWRLHRCVGDPNCSAGSILIGSILLRSFLSRMIFSAKPQPLYRIMLWGDREAL